MYSSQSEQLAVRREGPPTENQATVAGQAGMGTLQGLCPMAEIAPTLNGFGSAVHRLDVSTAGCLPAKI